MAIPSFSNSRSIRGTPQRQFSVASAESDLDMANRYMVFLDAARDAASIDGILSRCQRSTVAGWTSTNASLHRGHNYRKQTKADGGLGESGDSNERGRQVGGAGQEPRRAGLDAREGLTGPQGPSEKRDASPVECRAATPTSMFFARTRYWRGTGSSCASQRRSDAACSATCPIRGSAQESAFETHSRPNFTYKPSKTGDSRSSARSVIRRIDRSAWYAGIRTSGDTWLNIDPFRSSCPPIRTLPVEWSMAVRVTRVATLTFHQPAD